MNKTFFLFLFLLSIPPATAIYGSQGWHQVIDECDKLLVNISGNLTIDSGEYTLNNDCTEIDTNLYTCDCEDNYNLSLSFDYRTKNKYTIVMTTNFTIEEDEDDSSSSGGSSGGGGGGGGGGGYISTSPSKAKTMYLKPNIYYMFRSKGKAHSMKVINVTNSSIDLEIKSDIILLSLSIGEEKSIDLDKDDKADMSFKLKEIRGRISVIEIKEVSEPIEESKPEITPKVKEEVVTDTTTIEQPQEQPINDSEGISEGNTGSKGGKSMLIIVLVLIGIVLIIWLVWWFFSNYSFDYG